MVAPVKLIEFGFVVVSVPPHTVEVLLATVTPTGSVSLNATPASATVFDDGFVIVNVRNEVVFTGIDVGLNAFAIDGGATTVRLADAVLPIPPSFDDTWPVVLVNDPSFGPIIVTLNWHCPFAAMVAPLRL